MDKHGKAPKKARPKHATELPGVSKDTDRDTLSATKKGKPEVDHKTAINRGSARGR